MDDPSSDPLQADDFYSTLFDAIPCPTFLLDEDLGVIDFNVAAAKLAETVPDTPLRSRAGEFLHCIQTASGARCGTAPECSRCALRQASNQALTGHRAERRLHRTRLMRSDGSAQSFSLLVTASPFKDRKQPLTVVCIDDVTELMALPQLNPR